MPLQGLYTGVFPPHTYVPGTGPSGLLPVQRLTGPGIPPPTNSGGGMGVHPAVPVGGGYISQTRRRAARLDLIRGMDRTLGKTQTLPRGKRQSQGSKNLGNLSTQQALGPLTGALGRMFSAYF